ncbi:MAG: hypothetical protein HC872_09110 [Gammaproteobacteria bacterium]|nr:hypothetical protein [Gammaproteobacteria bacterium]
MLRATDGHILVFLPGVGEIMRCLDAIEPLAHREGCAVLPLFGDLPLRKNPQGEVTLQILSNRRNRGSQGAGERRPGGTTPCSPDEARGALQSTDALRCLARVEW